MWKREPTQQQHFCLPKIQTDSGCKWNWGRNWSSHRAEKKVRFVPKNKWIKIIRKQLHNVQKKKNKSLFLWLLGILDWRWISTAATARVKRVWKKKKEKAKKMKWRRRKKKEEGSQTWKWQRYYWLIYNRIPPSLKAVTISARVTLIKNRQDAAGGRGPITRSGINATVTSKLTTRLGHIYNYNFSYLLLLWLMMAETWEASPGYF